MSEQSNKYIVKNQKSLSAAVKKLTFFGPSIIFFGPPDIKNIYSLLRSIDIIRIQKLRTS